MRVTLKLFATFRRYLPPESQGSACQLEVPVATSVGALLGQFDVPVDGTVVILVNGRTAELDAVLQEGDAVAVFPALAGG
jgi:molybdopterin converting factor small subunit